MTVTPNPGMLSAVRSGGIGRRARDFLGSGNGAMGVLLHFVLSLAVVQGAFGDALSYLVPILVFSVGIDLDHVPFNVRTRRSLLRTGLGPESRSRFHELYGLLAFAVVLSVLSAFCDPTLVEVIALVVTMHFAVDFVLRRTRPLHPSPSP